MPLTYTLIASNTLTTSAASVTFSSIPSTYTDLVLRISARSDGAATAYSVFYTFNGSSTSDYSQVWLRGNGADAASSIQSNQTSGISLLTLNGAGTTSNTFSSIELYIPSYNASQNKPFSSFGAQENNNTTAYISAVANLRSNTAAVTSLTATAGSSTNFVSGSSFFLYGIKNS